MRDEQTIRGILERDYPERLNGGDVEGYVALYDDDVMWGVPNLPDATSKEGIRKLLGKILSKVEQTVTVAVDDLIVEGDTAIAMATATGTAARRPDGERQPLALRVMWALRRDGHDWRIIRQVGTPKPTG